LIWVEASDFGTTLKGGGVASPGKRPYQCAEQVEQNSAHHRQFVVHALCIRCLASTIRRELRSQRPQADIRDDIPEPMGRGSFVGMMRL
jgi:hypothetical protein